MNRAVRLLACVGLTALLGCGDSSTGPVVATETPVPAVTTADNPPPPAPKTGRKTPPIVRRNMSGPARVAGE
jgi:hypothetical protein